MDETQTTICCSIWAGTDNFSKSIVRSTVSISTIMQWPIHNTFKANERFSMGTLTRMKSIHFTKEHNKICMFCFFLNYFTSNINHYFPNFLVWCKISIEGHECPKMLFLFNSQITSVSMVTKELAKTQKKPNNLKTTLINQWQQQKTSFPSQNRRTPQQKIQRLTENKLI